MEQNVTDLSEHLKRKSMRTPLNDHIGSGIILATKAVLELVDRGFTVLGVMVGGPKPAIRIQSCAKCADLRGVWFRRQAPIGGAREDTMVAIVEGCQVQWTERGH